MSRRNPKVFCIGLDGATFDLVGPWARQGLLPNLAEIMQQGAYGRFESVRPPISAPAWASFMTGKNPGKHGVFGFKGFDEDTGKLHFKLSHSIKAKTIWELVGEQGRKVICINMPMTYPPKPINGIQVSGMGAPGIQVDFTYPPEVKREILQQTDGRYIIDIHWAGYFMKKDRRKIHAALRELFLMIELREKVVRYLMQKYPWDLFAVDFMATDEVQHYFWKYVDPSYPQYDPDEAKEFNNPVLLVYQRLDQIIGSIRKELGREVTLILLSDHGGGPLYEESIYLNEWLRREGFFVPVMDRRAGIGRIRHILRAGLFSLWKFLSRHASSGMKDRLSRWFPRVRGQVSAMVSLPPIDWSATKAFVAENVGTIRINRRVVVSGREREELCQALIAGIEKLVNPYTGERIIDKVYRREEIYQGPFVSEASDLLVETKDHAYLISKFLLHKMQPSVVVKKSDWRGLSGDHRFHGILLMAGKPIREGCPITGACLIDLAPTILTLLGLEIPDDMDGRVLTAALTDAFLAAHPARYAKGEGSREGAPEPEVYTPEEAQRMLDRLRGFGYLE